MTNQPHDEEVELTDEEEDSHDAIYSGSSGLGSGKHRFGDSPPNDDMYDGRHTSSTTHRNSSIDDEYGGHQDEDALDEDGYAGVVDNEHDHNDLHRTHNGDVLDGSDAMDRTSGGQSSSAGRLDDQKLVPNATVGRTMPMPMLETGDRGMMSGGEAEEDAEGATGGTTNETNVKVPKYNPADYSHLNEQVGSEIVSLFDLIERFKPQQVELDTKLKCFIPEYMPAMGDVDEFIKVARPDGRVEEAGT